MPRARLADVCPTARIDWQPQAMEQRTRLATLISYTIAGWAYVEATLGNLLALKCGTNTRGVHEFKDGLSTN
jgi:hypothetical protein